MNIMTIEKAPTVPHLAQTWMLVQVSPLGHKEFGQLKCLRNKCGPDTQHIIEYVMHGWPEFTDRVKQQTGYQSVPPLPHVGFLLRFYKIAVGINRLRPTRARRVRVGSSTAAKRHIALRSALDTPRSGTGGSRRASKGTRTRGMAGGHPINDLTRRRLASTSLKSSIWCSSSWCGPRRSSGRWSGGAPACVRTCSVPAKDKAFFYLFDYCQNLEFFSQKMPTTDGGGRIAGHAPVQDASRTPRGLGPAACGSRHRSLRRGWHRGERSRSRLRRDGTRRP